MEDFVTFELAKKLKEKGFKEECLAYYTTDIDFFYNTTLDSEVVTGFKSFNSNPNSICWKRIDAPTIHQVLKWLRKEKKMHIIIPASFDEDYWWVVRDFNREISEFSDNEFNSYEKAVIAGIEYVIDNLI